MDTREQGGTPELPKDFNSEVKTLLDSVISGITGSSVLDAMYAHLREQYNITPEEVPYRLNTVTTVLQNVFGVIGTKTIEKAVARRLFQNYQVDFVDTLGNDLSGYIELCKKRLAANLTKEQRTKSRYRDF